MIDLPKSLKVVNPGAKYEEGHMEVDYKYSQSSVRRQDDGTYQVQERVTNLSIKTELRVPRVGVMLVGWGGNNGSTLTAALLANKMELSWPHKTGEKKANWFGSITQSSTVNLGVDEHGQEVYIPMCDMLPMLSPNDIVFDGWDISPLNLAEAMVRAEVLDYTLQEQLVPHMKVMKPRPGIYDADFIAANQEDRARNVIPGSKVEQYQQIRKDIREFKTANNLDQVIVLWTANTERFVTEIAGVHLHAADLEKALKNGHPEISPSIIYGMASVDEGCSYINGSPQNTLVPGLREMAQRRGVFLGGDDFKSGQTKFKSVIVDFLVSAGIKPVSIVSYNHLGNNDGKNLSAPKQFRSKEITKSNVVDDMVAANNILFKKGEKPDHCVVIKYVPYVGDSKRAMDEYTSEILLGGHNTIVVHNTCEDSLLAVPIMLDLIILTELLRRVTVDNCPMDTILSLLSYLLKAPAVPEGAPVVNALSRQRSAIENILRACLGLSPLSHLQLEHRFPHLNSLYTKACNGNVVALPPPKKIKNH